MKSNIEAARKYIKHTAESTAVESFTQEKLDHLRDLVRDRLVQEFCLTPEQVDDLLDEEYARAIAEVISLGDPIGLAYAMQQQKMQDSLQHFMEMMDNLRAICAFRPIIFEEVANALKMKSNLKDPVMKELLQLMQDALPIMVKLHTEHRPLMQRWVDFLKTHRPNR